MDILHDQRKRIFAAIGFARLGNRTGRRISPKRFVICAPVIIAREAHTTGRPKDQHRGRKRQNHRPPRRLRSKPAMGRISKNFRRIERGKIRADSVVVALEGSPGCINYERRQSEENQKRTNPPEILTCSMSKAGVVQVP